MRYEIHVTANIVNEKPVAGAVPESVHADFDTAYEAALAVGGDRMVCPMLGIGGGKFRAGSCEYVPAVQS